MKKKGLDSWRKFEKESMKLNRYLKKEFVYRNVKIGERGQNFQIARFPVAEG